MTEDVMGVNLHDVFSKYQKRHDNWLKIFPWKSSFTVKSWQFWYMYISFGRLRVLSIIKAKNRQINKHT